MARSTPRFAHATIFGMTGQERVKIANSRAIIAVFQELDSVIVALVGQGFDDDRSQPQPQQQEQGEREDQAHDQRRRDDSLAAWCPCPLVLQVAKPALQAPEWTAGLLIHFRRTDGAARRLAPTR